MAKVLIVDDDVEIVDMISDWLKSENYIVEAAHAGREAQAFLEQYKYDLIILDWELPDKHGVDICREYRRQNGKAPILMLTGRDTIDFKTEGLDAGADDYLTKPFNLKEISARLRALLRRPAQLAESVLRMGALELDPKKHEVSLADKKLDLYPKDFAVLEFLMRNPQQFFDSQALLDHVWRAEDGVSSESVRQTIHRLRAELGDDHGITIENQRGVGYRIRITGG